MAVFATDVTVQHTTNKFQQVCRKRFLAHVIAHLLQEVLSSVFRDDACVYVVFSVDVFFQKMLLQVPWRDHHSMNISSEH